MAFLFIAISKLLNLIRIFLLFCVFVVVLSIIMPYVNQPNQYHYLQILVKTEHRIVDPVQKLVKQVIPTDFNDIEFFPYMKIVFLLILMSLINNLGWKAQFQGQYLKQRTNLKKLKQELKASTGGGAMMATLENKLEAIERSSDKKEQATLFDEFIKIKKKMESMSRYLSFLSIDVVDSTGIKQSENREMVQYDFLIYKRMVQGIFSKHGCLKAAWTPDGVMACFTSVDASVEAARDILQGLVTFNQKEKSIKRDFVVRCGINAGVVYYDENMPLEEMTDKTIDVAGHMQKYAKPGTIAISKPSIEPMQNTADFKAADREVDGYGVYEYELTAKPAETPPQKEADSKA